MRMLIKILAVICTIFYVDLVFAGTDGTIRGRVTDEESMGLAGATVYIPEIGAGTAADPEGNYIILNIPVGTYDVVVQMIGYKKKTFKDVQDGKLPKYIS